MFSTSYNKLIQFAQTSYSDLHLKLDAEATKTGTSILAIKSKDGIVIGADTQYTLGPMKGSYKSKVIDLIWADRQRYLLGLAGVAQISTFVVQVCNMYYEWYLRNFLTYPSIQTIIQHLRIVHSKTGWNNYAHIILVGNCRREHSYKGFCLKYGDLSELDTLNQALFIGSGYPYMSAVFTGEKSHIQSIDEAENLVEKCLKTSTNIDLYSGYNIHIYTMSNSKLTFKNIK